MISSFDWSPYDNSREDFVAKLSRIIVRTDIERDYVKLLLLGDGDESFKGPKKDAWYWTLGRRSTCLDADLMRLISEYKYSGTKYAGYFVDRIGDIWRLSLCESNNRSQGSFSGWYGDTKHNEIPYKEMTKIELSKKYLFSNTPGHIDFSSINKNEIEYFLAFAGKTFDLSRILPYSKFTIPKFTYNLFFKIVFGGSVISNDKNLVNFIQGRYFCFQSNRIAFLDLRAPDFQVKLENLPPPNQKKESYRLAQDWALWFLRNFISNPEYGEVMNGTASQTWCQKR